MKFLLISLIWHWRSRSINPQTNGDLNQGAMHLLSESGGSNFNWSQVLTWTSSKWGNFLFLSSIWTWRSWSIAPQNFKEHNQGLLHIWSNFGDPSLNGWWVIVQTRSGLTNRQTSVLHIWCKYQVKLDAAHSASTYLGLLARYFPWSVVDGQINRNLNSATSNLRLLWRDSKLSRWALSYFLNPARACSTLQAGCSLDM